MLDPYLSSFTVLLSFTLFSGNTDLLASHTLGTLPSWSHSFTSLPARNALPQDVHLDSSLTCLKIFGAFDCGAHAALCPPHCIPHPSTCSSAVTRARVFQHTKHFLHVPFIYYSWYLLSSTTMEAPKSEIFVLFLDLYQVCRTQDAWPLVNIQ